MIGKPKSGGEKGGKTDGEEVGLWPEGVGDGGSEGFYPIGV